MKIKEKFNHNILKINKDETLFINHIKINVVITIIYKKREIIIIKELTSTLNNIMVIHC